MDGCDVVSVLTLVIAKYLHTNGCRIHAVMSCILFLKYFIDNLLLQIACADVTQNLCKHYKKNTDEYGNDVKNGIK